MSILRNIFTRICRKQLIPIVNTQPANNFHILNQINSTKTKIQTAILNPIEFIVTPTCGFKVKGKLRRRCKDCYFVRRQERLYIICEKHPRHKQMSMIKDEKNTWILTHATQGKIRPW